MMLKVFIPLEVRMCRIFLHLRQCMLVKVVRLNTTPVNPIILMYERCYKFSNGLYAKELGQSDGEKPKFVEAFDDMEQADFVVDRLLALRDDGVALNNMAVLFDQVPIRINWNWL